MIYGEIALKMHDLLLFLIYISCVEALLMYPVILFGFMNAVCRILQTVDFDGAPLLITTEYKHIIQLLIFISSDNEFFAYICCSMNHLCIRK